MEHMDDPENFKDEYEEDEQEYDSEFCFNQLDSFISCFLPIRSLIDVLV